MTELGQGGRDGSLGSTCTDLQEELRPVPQVVGEDGRVEGLDAFLIEPALAAGVVLGQLLEVRPPGRLMVDDVDEVTPIFRSGFRIKRDKPSVS